MIVEDASRFTDLGVPQRLVHVTGNLKYDQPLPHLTNGSFPAQHSVLTVVVGSSREGEEKELLPVMQKLKNEIEYKFEETERGASIHISTRRVEALQAIYEFLRFQIKEHKTGDSLEVSQCMSLI